MDDALSRIPCSCSKGCSSVVCVHTMFRYPKAASTTEKGCFGEVCAIQWLPLLLPRLAGLAVYLRRDSPAYSACCTFPLNARRPTPPYSGEISSTRGYPSQPLIMWLYCGGIVNHTGTFRVLFVSLFSEIRHTTPLKCPYSRRGRSYLVGALCLHISPPQIDSKGVPSERVHDGSGKP